MKNDKQIAPQDRRTRVVENKPARPFPETEFDNSLRQGASPAGEVIDLGTEIGIHEKSAPGSGTAGNGSATGARRSGSASPGTPSPRRTGWSPRPHLPPKPRRGAP